jgi:hypothetical protein
VAHSRPKPQKPPFWKLWTSQESLRGVGMTAMGREPSLRLDGCAGSIGVVRAGSPHVGNWH